MSTNAKKQIDWVKYAGLAFAVAWFLFFAMRVKESNRIAQEQYEKRVAERKAEEEKQAALKAEQDTARKEAGTPETVPATGEEKKPVQETIKNSGTPPETPPEAPPKEPAKAPDKNVPAMEPEVEPVDVEVVNPHLQLTFSARGAGIASGWLADQYVTAKAQAEGKPGLELLGRIDPKQITLGMPYAKFAELEFTDLEQRVWFLESDSKGFVGPENVWTVAYSTTLYEPRAPFKPQCKVIKRFRIGQNARYVETDVDVVNLTEAVARFQYSLRGAAGVYMDGPKNDPTQGTAAYILVKSLLAGRRENSDEPNITIVTADKVATLPEEKRRSGASEGNPWATVSNRFFVTVMVARSPEEIVDIRTEPLQPDKNQTNDPRYGLPNQSVVFKTLPTRDVKASEKLSDAYYFFMGPMQEHLLEQYEKDLALEKPIRLDLAVQFCDVFGWRWPNIDRLSWLMMSIFHFIARFSGYGVAVILLTLCIKMALHPIQRKMNVSMHKMQALQPKLKAIEEKYAGQTKPEMKQKKEMEKWDLMKKEGANPASGCLPMFIQMPIFFALYGVFSRAFEIRQAHFLWIQDMSISDRLMTLDFWPHQLNLLPLIYIALTIIQSRLQPKPENPDPQQEMSRKMMTFMPVLFGFLFYKMPAGLVLYFAASSIFSFVESLYIKRFVLKVDRHGKPLSGEGGSGTDTKKPEPARANA